MSFRDLETGEPIVSEVVCTDDVVSPDSPRRDGLPDMVVLWTDRVSTADVGGVVSERYGEVRWDKGAKFPSGRSGNHTDHGWFVASGPGLIPGTSDEVGDIADLIPTAFRWLDLPIPDDFVGRPLPALARQEETSSRLG